jgi:membrane protein
VGSLKERLARRFAGLRERRPSVDHIVKTVTHYVAVNGNGQAGAVTFFGFLSFFPILALAFFVVGYVSTVYPDLRREVVQALEDILPGVVGTGEGQIPLSTFERYAGTVGLVGLAGVLYSGLGWLSGMRRALAVMFVKPLQDKPGFLVGKARDLLALGLIGVVLLVSISLSGAVSWFSGLILGWLGLDDSWLAPVVLWLVAHGLAIAATTVLFVSIFRFLSRPDVSGRALWQGAVVGALGFEVLKAAAGFLIAQTKGQPAFQAFGVALILVVWINYFSRLVMLSAAWAYTSPVAERVRELARRPLVDAADAEQVAPAPAAVAAEDPDGAPLPHLRGRRRDRPGLPALGAGVAAGVAALTWWARRRSL